MVRNLLAITRIDAGALELRPRLGRSAGRSSDARSAPPAATARRRRSMSLCRRTAAGARGRHAGRAGDRQRHCECRRHTPPKPVCRSTASVSADRVSLHVTDDGPGIAPEMLPRIFDKFVKASAADRGRRRRRAGDWSRPCYCQGHHGGSWRLDRGREPGCKDGRGTRLRCRLCAEAPT